MTRRTENRPWWEQLSENTEKYRPDAGKASDRTLEYPAMNALQE
jgi:hypothetical protein